MKYSKRKLWAAVPVVLAAGILMAAPAPKVSAKVRMNKTSAYLKSGSKLKLKVYGRGKKKIRWWKSTKPSVATVTKKGTVKAVAGGTAYIKAKVGGRTVCSKIKVYGPTKSIISLAPGGKYKVKVRYGRGTTFLKSYNKKVAKVSKSGKITAVAPGKTKILLKTRGKKIKMTVCVAQFKYANIQLIPGASYYASVLGGGEAKRYYSANPGIASVDANGVVTAHNYGSTRISCKMGVTTISMNINVVAGYVTPTSELPNSSKGEKVSVKVNAAGGPRVYTSYHQSRANGESARVKNFIGKHGCAACAAAGVMTGLNAPVGLVTPNQMIESLELGVLGYEWNNNYSPSNGKMPVSLLGITKVLAAQGIPSQYVQNFTDEIATNQIYNHLLQGKPVIIEVCSKNRETGVNDYKWSNSSHTLTLVGLASDGRAIILDSADRAETFGNQRRIKYEYIDQLVNYMFSNTRLATTSYYHTRQDSGGYILINR